MEMANKKKTKALGKLKSVWKIGKSAEDKGLKFNIGDTQKRMDTMCNIYLIKKETAAEKKARLLEA